MHMNKIKTKKGKWFIQKKSAHLPEKEFSNVTANLCMSRVYSPRSRLKLRTTQPVFILHEVGWNYVQPVFILLEVGWKDIQTNIVVHYKGTVSVEKCKNIIDTSDQLARDARPAFGGPWSSVNLLTRLSTQGVNSSLYICTTLIGKSW